MELADLTCVAGWSEPDILLFNVNVFEEFTRHYDCFKACHKDLTASLQEDMFNLLMDVSYDIEKISIEYSEACMAWVERRHAVTAVSL